MENIKGCRGKNTKIMNYFKYIIGFNYGNLPFYQPIL